MPHFVDTRRIDFADTDMGGIVHFSRYLAFIETAEHRFLESLGHSVVYRDEKGFLYSWPRVAVSVEYIAPLRFGQHVNVEVTVERVGRSSVDYTFSIVARGKVRAKLKETVVYCRLHETEGVHAVPIPEELREKIEDAIERHDRSD